MQINNKTKDYIQYWNINGLSLHISNAIFDNNGNLIEAEVENGGWLLIWNGKGYDACDYSRYVVNTNIGNGIGIIHYTQMTPTDVQYGEELSHIEITHIVTESTYQYQPGETLVETFLAYNKCLNDGTDGNINYLYNKLLEQMENADTITATFTTKA